MVGIPARIGLILTLTLLVGCGAADGKSSESKSSESKPLKSEPEKPEAKSTPESTEAESESTEPESESTESESSESESEKKPAYKPPRFTERQMERDDMVKTQMRDVKNEKVLEAMKNVPRHEFMPATTRSSAYADRPVPIGYGQTISQPYIVAYMTEALKLEPGQKVLEIGTGSAYQAAILSELTEKVYSIEIVKPLAESAKKRLKELGYTTIETTHADGYHGWKKHAPFDAIIVTCAATHVPPPLIAQLKDGGRMVIPVGGRFSFQELLVVEKKDGKVKSKSMMGVVFVPLTRWTKDKGGK